MTAAAETAHQLRARVRTHLAAERDGWPPLAAAVHAIHEHEAWRELGADSFADWIAQEDVGRRRGYLLVSAWDTCGHLDLKGTELTKFSWVVGPVRRGELEPEDALADVRTLSRSDLREKYGTVREREDKEEVELCLTCGQQLPR